MYICVCVAVQRAHVTRECTPQNTYPVSNPNTTKNDNPPVTRSIPAVDN